MKKIHIHLLLACSISTFAQAEFPEGIQVTNIQDNTALKVNVQNATGVINWKYLADFQKEKAILSTGLLKNGLISANGDPTKFNITAGIGIISNFDDPENPTSTIVNFPEFTGITPTYLLTGTITYVAINSTPAVVMQATPFTPEQRRSLIVLGAVIHSNLTTINVLNNISAPSNASTNQLHDFIEAVGALNLTGNKYTANGANLQLNKSAGLIFKLGSNFANDWKNPHELAQSAMTSLTFRYRTQNGTEGSDRINLDPALYDLNNVLTAVPNNKFTIQTVVMFQSGLTRILYGQNIYDDLASAKNAIFTRNFVIESNAKENGIIRAYIIMRNTTTSLQSVADADIQEAQKFGGVASGGVALTLANIVTALGYTPENVANKATDFTTVSNTSYPSTLAVSNQINSTAKTVNETEEYIWANKLMFNCGDSTTWQMQGTGFGFDKMTTFHRLAGNQMENITGYVNFGASGYTLSGFVNDALATPPTFNTTSNLGIGSWDYYGHNIQIPISQKTAIAYRKSLPTQEAVWVLSFGINDLILSSANGNLAEDQIVTYLTGYLNTAIANFKLECPDDKVILRIPNTMAARPYDAGAGFPSPTEYPTFGVDKPTDVILVTKWNTAIRKAYLKVSQENLNTILFDTHKRVFELDLSAEVDANLRPNMGDLVHPNGPGYISIADELAYIFKDTRVNKQEVANLEAEKRAVLLVNNAWDNNAEYVFKKEKFNLVLSNGSWIVGGGSNYLDLPYSITDFNNATKGLPIYVKSGNVTYKITSYSASASAANTRLTGISIPAKLYNSKADLNIYMDAFDRNTFVDLATAQTVAGVKTFLNGTIGFRNVANTFTSFFTNTNTASRTYTFQNRNGIIADDTDLALKSNLASPVFTGDPKAPTPTLGDNDTSVATTAFVQTNANVGSLEVNFGNKTIWNNGNGNVGTNTSFGEGAMSSNVSGGNNSAFGQYALAFSTNNSNSAFGHAALYVNSSGSDNSAFGNTAMIANTTGSKNLAIGTSSLSTNISGSNNVAIGYVSGTHLNDKLSSAGSPNNSVFMGYDTSALLANGTNEIVIGYNADGGGSNTATLGNTSITKTVLRGNVETNGTISATNIPVQLKDFYSDVNNVSTTETDLLTYTTVANRLNAVAEKIVSNFAGTFNDATASSQLKIYFGGQNIGDTGALTMSVTGAWVTTVSIIRTGTTTARAVVNISTPVASTASYTKYTSLTGVTFTGTNIIKITGTAAGATGGDNDITATYGNIIWQPAAL